MTNYDQGFALKIQFWTSSKVYEYFIPSDGDLAIQLPNLNFDGGDIRAVVDARGEPKVVRVIGIIPYDERFFDGDLKPVVALFEGTLLYVKPDQPKPKREREGCGERDDGHGDYDDEIPF